MRIPIAAAATILLAVGVRPATAAPAAAPAGDRAAPGPLEMHPTGLPGMAGAVRIRRVTATVKGVDAPNRVLILVVEGRTQNIKVGPEVKRFGEIAAGDVVKMEIQQGLLLEYRAPGSETVEPTVTTDVARAEASEAPAGTITQTTQATVTVTRIDLENRMVTLQGPEGGLHEVKAGPKLPIEKLKVGDKLLATYADAMALKLEKKQRKPAAKTTKPKT